MLINSSRANVATASWTVIGAGPAGITTVGLLLDLGVPAADIVWVDPEFNVGRIGQHYATVPANTKTKLFIEFVNACKAFQECESPALAKLHSYDPEWEYPLQIIVDPLQDITAHLKGKVNALQTNLLSLHFEQDAWQVGVKDASFTSHYVVLATGCHPRTLNYACDHEIPLDVAMNPVLLKQHITNQDSVAVIGSSHSAILVLKFLSELSTKRIINFYKNPLQYAVDMGDWVLHNANGLKGIAAQWAKDCLEKDAVPNLVRVRNTERALDTWLPLCNKIIYAIGYERNELPPINTMTMEELTYDDTTGIIAPRLFGIGIAFPEKYTDPLGNVEHRVGLNSFMEYAQRVIPQWMKKESNRFVSFASLFTIDAL